MSDTQLNITNDADCATDSNAMPISDQASMSPQKRPRAEDSSDKKDDARSSDPSSANQSDDRDHVECDRERKRQRLHPQPHARHLNWQHIPPYMNFEFTSTPVPIDTIGLGIEHDSTCPICGDGLAELFMLSDNDHASPSSGSSILPGLACHRNGCGRTFHRSCFMAWDDHKQQERDSTTCPVCRATICERNTQEDPRPDANNNDAADVPDPVLDAAVEDIAAILAFGDIAAAIRSVQPASRSRRRRTPGLRYTAAHLASGLSQTAMEALENVRRS